MSNHRLSPTQDQQQSPLWILFFVVGLILLIFVLRVNLFAFLLLVLLLLLAGGLAYLIYSRAKRKEQIRYENSTEGMIAKWLGTCQEQIDRMKGELTEIQRNITELKEKLADTPSATEVTKQETTALIQAFHQEEQLRLTKIAFYSSCMNKLHTLKANQELVNTLGDKKAKLKSLQEHHYEDIANMEELRAQLSHDQRYLETIETLSLRMLESTDLSSAEGLQLELKQLTEEVRRL